jgi:peptide/nickel transport system permease protein
MRRLAMHIARLVAVMLLGGLLGATLVRVAPGFGTDESDLDGRLSSASIQALRQSNANHENIAIFYFHYLGRLVHGDLGMSRTLGQPVRQLLADRLPETLKSVGLGLALAWTLGLSLALAAVVSKKSYIDLFGSFLAGILLCIPAAVLAILFVITRAPARLALGLIVFPRIFTYARTLLFRTASLPHVLTARAKGIGNARVLCWHILPVAAPQLFALAGVSVSLAFAAAIPVEALCDLPGIGQLAWKAALGRDLELLVILTMIVTAVTLTANSASDLLGHVSHAGEV